MTILHTVTRHTPFNKEDDRILN